MGSAERRNRRDKKKPALSMQKSAEAIVPRKLGKGGTKAAGVTGERPAIKCQGVNTEKIWEN